MSPTCGDAVVTPRGRIGLCVRCTPAGNLGVQFVSNGTLHYWPAASLRRATIEEIERSTLAGVGCNQSQETQERAQ